MAAEAYNDNLSLVINDQKIAIPQGDQPPVIKANRVYVPLRIISENLGSQVNWLPATKQVVIMTDTKYKQVPTPEDPNKIQIVIDEEPLEIPLSYGAPFLTDNGRTMVPLRIIGESLGCQVEWLSNERTVEIKSKKQNADDGISYIPTPGNSSDDNSSDQPEPVLTNDERNLINKLASYKTNIRLSNGTLINTAQLLTMAPADFTSTEINHLRSIEKLLDQYKPTIQLPNGSQIRTSELTIMGSAMATADQLNDWIARETPRIKAKMANLGREFIPVDKELAELYISIGKKYGIRGDLAFAQAAKETHYFQFTGSVQPYQNNYCGLSATGTANTGNESLNGADPDSVYFEKGVHGAIFATPEVGVEAHIQHLYAYATDKPLPAGTVLYDPRYTLVSRGIAPTWVGLNARWAVPGTTYGQSIIQDYWLYALNS
ncbi:stalk domain-containing protein [Peptococcaceae bacterium 1198_IL3148]